MTSSGMEFRMSKKRRAVVAVVFGLMLFTGCGAGKEDVVSHISRFQNALEVAGATPRIALSSPVEQMQTIKMELETLKLGFGASKPLRDARAKAVEGMGHTIQGFLAFMQGREAMSSYYFLESGEALQEAHALLSKCH